MHSWRKLLTLAVLLGCGGCHYLPKHHQPPPIPPTPSLAGDMPRELAKTVLPPYIIEPPDILVIEAIHVVPKSPYFLKTADVLSIDAPGSLVGAPITGLYQIEPGGFVNLGPPYGRLSIAGQTVDQAKATIEEYLKTPRPPNFPGLTNPQTFLTLAQMSGLQQIAGQHLVGPDGTVTLGSYGSVLVVGKTIGEARAAIEAHLAQFLDSPQVAVDVFAYNSKVYYIISQGAGFGDAVTRYPVTGNETVLDAISNVNGLTEVSSKRIWIARPVPHSTAVQVLPVDWDAITAQGSTVTNYQMLPGDRLFVAEDKLVAWDTQIGKLTAPFERAMGFSLLGVGTVTRFSGAVLQGGGNPSGSGGGP